MKNTIFIKGTCSDKTTNPTNWKCLTGRPLNCLICDGGVAGC